MVKTRYVFPKSGHFFPVFEKGQGKPLSPSSSYAPDLTCHYSCSHIYFPLKCTFKMIIILFVTFHVRVHFQFLQMCFNLFHFDFMK